MSWGVSGVFSDCPYDIMDWLCRLASQQEGEALGLKKVSKPNIQPGMPVQLAGAAAVPLKI